MGPLYSHVEVVLILLFAVYTIPLSPSMLPRTPNRCVESQRLALAELKQDFVNHTTPSVSFDENSSKRMMEWNMNEDCCSWNGVTCDPAGYVIGLNLSFSMVSGHISAIFKLQHLQSLNLARNHFQFTPIPSGFQKLRNLTYLNLSYCCFSDQIPMEISTLTKLVSLDLSTMSFCELPPTFDDPDSNRIFAFEVEHRLRLEKPNLGSFFRNLNALRVVYLDYVDLSAQGSDWSAALSSALPDLEVLSLSHCGLNGHIHRSFARLKSLSYLRLDFNNLSSEVPSLLGDFFNLESLNLASSQLYGDFPENVFLLPKLRSIDISQNDLLNGQLPEFPKHSSLQFLAVYETSFQGELPESIGNLQLLENLLIYTCAFSGLLPSSLANLTGIVELDISYNKFNGYLPPFQGHSVPKLSDLRVSFNLLTGGIDSSVFTLPSLKTLYLNDNKFNGELKEFSGASLSVLEILSLEGNQLSGSVPTTIFELPNLTYLSLASNNFSGSVKLEMLQNLKNLTTLDLSSNSLTVETDVKNFDLPQLVELHLRKCNLSEFPTFLKSQVSLRTLNLSDNNIQGYVPSWLGNNNTLNELDLSHNPVDFPELGNGSFATLGKLVMRSCNMFKFPEFLKGLDALWFLDLSDNKIDGQTPSWIWKDQLQYVNISHNLLSAISEFHSNVSLDQLATLDLHANLLQGSLPAGLCNLSNLSILEASHNHLSGLIPDCLVRIETLSVLNFQGNKYNEMPSSFTLGSSLRSLNINGNRLQGKLPRSLANCSMLEILDLGNNLISDTFPFWLEKLSALKVLVLRNNKLYGQVELPRTQFVLPNLRIIDLSSNILTGELPRDFLQSLSAMVMAKGNESVPKIIGQYGYYQDSVTIMSKGNEMTLVRILTIFVSLDLSNNMFKGKIPAEIGGLKSLVVLNLSRNAFDGKIPSSLQELSQLESLDLSQNKFSGVIPPELTRLTFLEVLNLSYNQLVGRIPLGNQFNTFDNTSYIGNAGICGTPLSRKCSEDAANTLPPPSRDESSETEAMFDWTFAGAGYGFGVVVGMTVGFAFLADMIVKRLVRVKKRSRRKNK